jgi:hypothetical protein
MFDLPKFGDGIALHRIERFFQTHRIDRAGLARRSIAVTGTNGKGSTARFMTSAIAAAGRCPLGDVKAVGMQPSQGGFGILSPQVIAAGDPFRSTLLYRMSTVGPGRMPHIGSEVVDDRGLALIHDWIARLPANFADNQLIEQLVKRDEATVLERESREAPEQRWKLAKRIAAEDGRRQPKDADLALAEEEGRRQAADRAQAREKDRERLIGELLFSTSRAVMLAGAIRQGRLPSAIRSQVVAAALRHPEPVIAGLFEEFVPAGQRLEPSCRLGVPEPTRCQGASPDPLFPRAR